MGGIMPLPISEIKAICEVYDATLSDFERILKIEQAVFPLLQEQAKIESEKNKNK